MIKRFGKRNRLNNPSEWLWAGSIKLKNDEFN